MANGRAGSAVRSLLPHLGFGRGAGNGQDGARLRDICNRQPGPRRHSRPRFRGRFGAGRHGARTCNSPPRHDNNRGQDPCSSGGQRQGTANDAFLLLGGARRHVPQEARVLVHQIWLGSKSKRALESSYSAEEISRVQRDVGSLARYTVEMGGGIELIEAALRVPPWEPMHELSGEEIRRMRLATIDWLFDDQTPTGSVTTGQSTAPTPTTLPPPATPAPPVRARRAGN